MAIKTEEKAKGSYSFSVLQRVGLHFSSWLRSKDALMSFWIIAANRKAQLKAVNVSRAVVTLLLRCCYREVSITNLALLDLLIMERHNATLQN